MGLTTHSGPNVETYSAGHAEGDDFVALFASGPVPAVPFSVPVHEAEAFRWITGIGEAAGTNVFVPENLFQKIAEALHCPKSFE